MKTFNIWNTVVVSSIILLLCIFDIKFVCKFWIVFTMIAVSALVVLLHVIMLTKNTQLIDS